MEERILFDVHLNKDLLDVYYLLQVIPILLRANFQIISLKLMNLQHHSLEINQEKVILI